MLSAEAINDFSGGKCLKCDKNKKAMIVSNIWNRIQNWMIILINRLVFDYYLQVFYQYHHLIIQSFIVFYLLFINNFAILCF